MSNNFQFEQDMQGVLRQIRPGLMGVNSQPSRNLSVVLEDLRANPKWLALIREHATDFLIELNYVSALTESGLMSGDGFFAELFTKIEYKFLPKEIDDSDFLAFLNRLFTSVGVSEWIEKVDDELIGQFLAMILPDGEKFLNSVAPQLFEALEILTLRLAYHGFEDDVTSRLRDRPDLQGAFLSAQRNLQKLLEGKGQQSIVSMRHDLERCLEACKFIRSHREKYGISLGLTFRLMRIQENAQRIISILDILETVLGEWKFGPTVKLLKTIFINETGRFDLRSYISQHISMLAYQITEHTGRTGEHYITSSRSEYKAMAQSAAIGGSVVAILTIIKALIPKQLFAPGPLALIYGSVYASGFVIIHTIGGTLASKQPAMTASRIAAALDEAKSSDQAMFNLCEMIVRTIRSQLIALLGNYCVAMPVAFLLASPLTGYGFIKHEAAEHLLGDIHPWKSGSLIYAAIAGVCLFTAGILAGAADNWFVFNRVGVRLRKSSFMKSLFSKYSADKVVARVERSIGFWVGNISLGFMLGSMGSLGKIMGLPLDIRHVTFASGQMGIALSSLAHEVTVADALIIAAGVFCIGLVNLGVSFSLTLYVTMKSRRIRFSQTRELFKLLVARFRHRPLDFFFPPKEALLVST